MNRRKPISNRLSQLVKQVLSSPRLQDLAEGRPCRLDLDFRADAAFAKPEIYECLERIGFIVTHLTRPSERVVKFENGRGTAEPHIQEGKNALRLLRSSIGR